MNLYAAQIARASLDQQISNESVHLTPGAILDVRVLPSSLSRSVSRLAKLSMK